MFRTREEIQYNAMMLTFHIQEQSRALAEVSYRSLNDIGSPHDVKELLYWAHAIATNIHKASVKLERDIDKLKHHDRKIG